jgi:steroid 5-alpha reductase family enzyme
LYFFSFVGGIGLGLCTETLTLAALFAVGFALYYPFILRTEESFLSSQFSEYEEYKKRVPLFFPRWSNFADGQTTVYSSRFRNEIVAAGGFLCLIGLFEFLEALHETQVLPTYFFIP